MGQRVKHRQSSLFRAKREAERIQKEYLKKHGAPCGSPSEYPRDQIHPDNPLFAPNYFPLGRFNPKEQQDYHAWVEDDDGTILFDPQFPEEQLGAPMNMLMDQPQYIKWDELEQKKQKDFMVNHKDFVETLRDSLPELYKNPQHLRCFWNALAYVKYAKRGKMVIGSKGYKCADGSVFWLWG